MHAAQAFTNLPGAAAVREAARAARQDAGPVPSPCTAVCRIDAASGLCEGCLRTITEITAWSQLPEAGRRALWLQLEQRAGAPA